MARLIKADDLKVEIANYFLSCVDKGKIVIDITEMQVELYKIVNSQPTAYNMEKVVEELESLRIDKSNYFGVLNVVAEKYDRANEMLNDAIDIVRRGGVE